MRSVVERCIGLLKSRFRCLQRYRALHYEPERAANIVAACAVLHNLCLDEGDVLLDDVSDDSSNSSSDDESGNPSPQRVPRVRASRMMYLRGCAARDRVISSFGTTRQQHQHYLKRVRRRCVDSSTDSSNKHVPDTAGRCLLLLSTHLIESRNQCEEMCAISG